MGVRLRRAQPPLNGPRDEGRPGEPARRAGTRAEPRAGGAVPGAGRPRGMPSGTATCEGGTEALRSRWRSGRDGGKAPRGPPVAGRWRGCGVWRGDPRRLGCVWSPPARDCGRTGRQEEDFAS